MGLFTYNRGNYGYDQKMQYGRYNAGIGMACAQTGQYKADVNALTTLTMTRQHVYHDIAAMGLTILTALYCPGRLGLHTPPPPAWLMGLFMLNVAGTYLFLGLTLWLAQHAFSRSGISCTHMLTRFVRFPIPSMTMLDRARRFLSSFEEQSVGEAFRIPFRPHQHALRRNQGGYNEYEDSADPMAVEDAAQKRTRHGYDVPAWYRKEMEIRTGQPWESMHKSTNLPLSAKGEAPEHFEFYREMQNEWWPYDVYARLCLFLAFMHLLHNWNYHQLGHAFAETRALFAAGCVTLMITVLQNIVLTLDIVPNSWEAYMIRIGPFGPWFAYVATAIEYKKWYSPGVQAFGFFLVYCTYAIHIIYTILLIRLCAPSDQAPDSAETPGASWWPQEWQLPSAFQHAIWLVAPPKKRAQGEIDIVEQLRNPEGKSADGGTAPTAAEKRKDVHQALGRQYESTPWWNVKVGLFAMLAGWVFLTFGFTIEVINQGTAHPALLNAPGMPNNARDPRYRPAKPGMHEVTEVGTGGAEAGPARGVHADAVARRLQSFHLDLEVNDTRKELAHALREVLPYLNKLADGVIPAPDMEAKITSIVPQELAIALGEAPAPVPVQVRWPPLFEPKFIAAGPKFVGGPMAAVLSHHGRGTIVNMPAGTADRVFAESKPFVLEGTAEHGPLASASWEEAGLLVATVTGAVLECPGSGPVGGRWRCAPIGSKLPIASAGKHFDGAVALSRCPIKKMMRAAVAFPGESSVAIFNHNGQSWLPAGESRTHAPATAISFIKDDHLLLSSADGAVAKLSMTTGVVSATAKAPHGLEAGHEWKSACHMSDGGIARLAMMKNGDAQEPTMFLG